MGKVQAIKEKKKINWNIQIPYILMVLPGFILTLIFGVFPKIGTYMAFTNYNFVDGIFGSPFVGLDNFKYVLGSGEIWGVVLQTIGYHFLLSIPNMFLAPLLAILLYYVKNKFASKLFQEAISLPYLLSYTVIGYIYMMFLSYDNGLVNSALEKMGIERISWYTTPGPWPIFFLIGIAWFGAGIRSIYYYSTLMAVDESLFESVRLDGGNRWHEIRYIMVPQMMPIICIFLITQASNILAGGSYAMFNSLTAGSPALYGVTNVLDTYIVRAIFQSTYGTTTALSIITAGFTTVTFYGLNWIVKKINPEYAYI